MTENLQELGDWVNRPEELTRLLYKGLLLTIADAQQAILAKQYGEANHLCQKAYEIVARLDGGLNYDAGPLADRLHQLYSYSAEQILQADLQKRREPLELVETIITQLDEAWELVVKQKQTSHERSDRGRQQAINPYIEQENLQEQLLRITEVEHVKQKENLNTKKREPGGGDRDED